MRWPSSHRLLKSKLLHQRIRSSQPVYPSLLCLQVQEISCVCKYMTPITSSSLLSLEKRVLCALILSSLTACSLLMTREFTGKSMKENSWSWIKSTPNQSFIRKSELILSRLTTLSLSKLKRPSTKNLKAFSISFVKPPTTLMSKQPPLSTPNPTYAAKFSTMTRSRLVSLSDQKSTSSGANKSA